MTSRRELVGLWPEMAFQYYVLARVAKRCGYWYPAARCAHFAVELMLKYLLFLPIPWPAVPPWPGRGQPLTPEQIPRTHDLIKLWRRFDACAVKKLPTPYRLGTSDGRGAGSSTRSGERAAG